MNVYTNARLLAGLASTFKSPPQSPSQTPVYNLLHNFMHIGSNTGLKESKSQQSHYIKQANRDELFELCFYSCRRQIFKKGDITFVQ